MSKKKQICNIQSAVCIGSMKFPIQIINSEINPEAIGFTINFDDFVTTYAAIQTRTGVETFDGSNISHNLTHIFYIRYGIEVEALYHIRYNEKFYIVMDVEDMGEEKRFLKLTTTERGVTINKASWS